MWNSVLSRLKEVAFLEGLVRFCQLMPRVIGESVLSGGDSGFC